ncbi:SIN component Cdc14 [Schizosaccharomyces japonicus yFS275]|uniref:SIN component Cdc14 n=1 Tax=Schizosaccharomyces japonicus (strain yFS275 / FY16936) TaxID=402676 RepID=B6K1W9_SCHJY|nr:SIN component Cdc14 [Schizosaccharomyces japonicus yFS275]EEB07150.1 SIN component Cdc14 [Schizosaccharomyces japonicus yFS275]
MESLLRTAYENLCSEDVRTVKVGLRQAESVVFQVSKPTEENRVPLSIFLKLQESFLYNLTTPCLQAFGQLVKVHYEAVQAQDADTETLVCKLLCDILHVMEGLVLLHPPSQLCYNSEAVLDLFGRLLRVSQPVTLQVAAVKTLVCVMVDRPIVMRAFERIGGLARVCMLFKNKQTHQQTKLQALEFFYFYLSPEPYTLEHEPYRKTRTEKQAYLSTFLSNVDGLRKDLDTFQPFGRLDESHD